MLIRRIFKLIKQYLSIINLNIKFRHLGSVGNNVQCDSKFTIYNGRKNLFIGNNVFLTNTLINAGDFEGKVTIKDFVFFGHNVLLLARGHDYNKFAAERQISVVERAIVIEEGAWIGSGSIILAGVTIGKNSVIGAGSVVTKNVPDNVIYGYEPSQLYHRVN